MKKKISAAALCLVLSVSAFGCEQKKEEIPTPPVTEETVLPESPTVPDLPEEQLPATPETPSVPETPSTPAQPETPSAPQTPATPVVEKDTLLSSTANSLNVRKGAGTKYAAIGTLDNSDMVMPVRKTGDWYEIYYRNSVGYVSAAYVKPMQFDIGATAVEKVINEGKKLLGIPYVFGAARYHWGNGVLNTDFTGKSYDCSSLMQYIFKCGANVNLAMTSREQSVQGKEIARKNIRRGDLLFFTNASRVNKKGIERIGHVALYLGNNIILHTASDHAVIEPISAQRSAYYITARRVL